MYLLLSSQVIWFSSGGTKSVLHNDDVDNINCLFRGQKELLFANYTKYRHQVSLIQAHPLRPFLCYYLCPCNGRDIVLVVDILLLLLLLLLQLAFAKPWPHIGLGLRLRQLFRKHVLF